MRKLFETLKRVIIKFPSLEGRLDTGPTPGGLVFLISNAIAHFERRLVVTGIRDGSAAVRVRGAKPE
ncbi:MAG: hypothetical protein V2I43_18420 [Parvularcula sp.]|nr:hypothetical protein [Parvularcula sp.]